MRFRVNIQFVNGTELTLSYNNKVDAFQVFEDYSIDAETQYVTYITAQ